MFNCTDCNVNLARIDYVRRLRPGEQIHKDEPLCKPCWQKDDAQVKAEIKKGQ